MAFLHLLRTGRDAASCGNLSEIGQLKRMALCNNDINVAFPSCLYLFVYACLILKLFFISKLDFKIQLSNSILHFRPTRRNILISCLLDSYLVPRKLVEH